MRQGLVGDEPAARDQGGQGLVHPEGQRLPAQLQRRLVLPQPPAESPGQDGSGEERRRRGRGPAAWAASPASQLILDKPADFRHLQGIKHRQVGRQRTGADPGDQAGIVRER